MFDAVYLGANGSNSNLPSVSLRKSEYKSTRRFTRKSHIHFFPGHKAVQQTFLPQLSDVSLISNYLDTFSIPIPKCFIFSLKEDITICQKFIMQISKIK